MIIFVIQESLSKETDMKEGDKFLLGFILLYSD